MKVVQTGGECYDDFHQRLVFVDPSVSLNCHPKSERWSYNMCLLVSTYVLKRLPADKKLHAKCKNPYRTLEKAVRCAQSFIAIEFSTKQTHTDSAEGLLQSRA